MNSFCIYSVIENLLINKFSFGSFFFNITELFLLHLIETLLFLSTKHKQWYCSWWCHGLFFITVFYLVFNREKHQLQACLLAIRKKKKKYDLKRWRFCRRLKIRKNVCYVANMSRCDQYEQKNEFENVLQ